jgi:hypothetical protein
MCERLGALLRVRLAPIASISRRCGRAYLDRAIDEGYLADILET